jgi:hypothetical protein
MSTTTNEPGQAIVMPEGATEDEKLAHLLWNQYLIAPGDAQSAFKSIVLKLMAHGQEKEQPQQAQTDTGARRTTSTTHDPQKIAAILHARFRLLDEVYRSEFDPEEIWLHVTAAGETPTSWLSMYVHQLNSSIVELLRKGHYPGPANNLLRAGFHSALIFLDPYELEQSEAPYYLQEVLTLCEGAYLYGLYTETIFLTLEGLNEYSKLPQNTRSSDFYRKYRRANLG